MAFFTTRQEAIRDERGRQIAWLYENSEVVRLSTNDGHVLALYNKSMDMTFEGPTNRPIGRGNQVMRALR